jgi:hypothetical protein
MPVRDEEKAIDKEACPGGEMDRNFCVVVCVVDLSRSLT